MEKNKIKLNEFYVIGKEGTSADGADFVKKLWEEANAHFDEIKYLAKYNEDGSLAGVWGCMSDFGRNFLPWKNFENGLYLAGVETFENAVAPKGWTKWKIPAFEYIKIPAVTADTFKTFIDYMIKNKIELVGAVQDYTDLKTGTNYLLFPIKKL